MNIYSDLVIKSLNKVPYSKIEKLSEMNAIRSYRKALKVPGYKEFIKSKKFELNINSIELFRKVPITEKGNYISGKELPEVSISKQPFSYYRSSGYSGKPTYWSQSAEDYSEFTAYEGLNLDLVFNIYSKKTLIVSMFALSSWVTGQQVLASLFEIAKKRKNISVFACGMVYDEPLDMISKFGKEFEQIIIFTYPLTFKAFVDEATAHKVDLSEFNIKLVLGAEGVPYKWASYYDEVLNGTNAIKEHRIYSAFGSADTGVGIAAEQLSCLLIKDFCHDDPELLERITGNKEMPLHFFQYNPIDLYLETVNDNLIITKFKQVPLIRYNLHDRAKIIRPDAIVKACKNKGIDLKKIVKEKGGRLLNLPYLLIYGRDDGTVILNGANIYLNSFHEALAQKEVINLHTGRFSVSAFSEADMFQNYEIKIELKPGVEPSNENKEKIRNAVTSFLLEKDKGYSAAYHLPYGRKDVCKVEFVKFPNSLKHKYK